MKNKTCSILGKDWETRERDYLMDLCRECGIEVEIKGNKRDNLTLPEYKVAMQKVEHLEAEAEKPDKQNETLEQWIESLQKRASDLHGQVQEKQELSEQAKQLASEAYKLESGITKKQRNTGI